MGVVYRAEDIRLGRAVALKFLLPSHGLDTKAEARFFREAQVVAALDHPNLCAIHEVGVSDDGRPFLAMPLYPGENLRARMSRDGPMQVSDVLAIAKQIAEGLECAHGAGIVHRDLKPGNVMLLPDGALKVLDFGLAKAPDHSLTESGALFGTVSYMAPEQIRGEPLDGRTDIYSLGCIAFESLTGGPPFRGDSPMELIYSHLNQTPPPVRTHRPELPPGVEAVLERAMAKDLEDRYPRASELATALRAALTGAVPAATLATVVGVTPPPPIPVPPAPLAPSAGMAPPPPGRPAPSRGRPRRIGLIAAGAALVVAAAVGAVIFLGKDESTTSSTSGSPTSRPSASVSPRASPSPSTAGTPSTPGPVVRTWQRVDSAAFGGAGDQTMNRVLATQSGVVAVGYDGPTGDLDAAAWTSPDGRYWTEATIPGQRGNQGLAAVAAGGPGLVAVGTDAGGANEDAAVWTSKDGRTWTRGHSRVFGGPGDQSMRRVVAAPPGLVAVGYDGRGDDLNASVWLFDGRTWSLQHSPSFGGPGDQEMRSAVPFRGGLVAVGDNGAGADLDGAAWRFDGSNWTRVHSPSLGGPGDQEIITVERGGPGLVAVGTITSLQGDQDAAVWTSSDGTDWHRVTDPAALGGKGNQAMIGVVATAGGLVAVGFDDATTDSVVWTSVDGEAWTREDGPEFGGAGQQQIKAITAVGQDVLAVGRVRVEGTGGRDENAAVWFGSPG